MLSTDELYSAAVIRTAAEWEALTEVLCTEVNSTNLFIILDRLAEVAIRLPAASYACSRAINAYNRIDDIARRKAELGVL